MPIDPTFDQGNTLAHAQKFKNQADFDVFKRLADNKNLCTLKYVFAFSEVACTYLNEIFQKDPKIIRDPRKLFMQLFKTFILLDKANSHPIVEVFLQNLYHLGIPDDEKIKF